MTLSDYIKSDLRQRITAADELPKKLTISSLAEHYEVSTMPVRTAVNALITEKVLRKGDNGRLKINFERGQRSHAKSGRVVSPPDWGNRILDDAIQVSLHGEAVQWKIAETADRYAISQNLVQTIFHRLAGNGVLEHAPRRGWWIRPFRKEDLDAYLKVRVTLELQALDLSRERLDRDMLRQLLEANQPSCGKTPPMIDNALHRYWVKQSGNRYIQDFFDRHGNYYSALYTYASIGDRLLNQIVRRHRAILQSLIRGHFRQARDVLCEDVQSLRPILIDTIRRLEETQTLTLGQPT